MSDRKDSEKISSHTDIVFFKEPFNLYGTINSVYDITKNVKVQCDLYNESILQDCDLNEKELEIKNKNPFCYWKLIAEKLRVDLRDTIQKNRQIQKEKESIICKIQYFQRSKQLIKKCLIEADEFEKLEGKYRLIESPAATLLIQIRSELKASSESESQQIEEEEAFEEVNIQCLLVDEYLLLEDAEDESDDYYKKISFKRYITCNDLFNENQETKKYIDKTSSDITLLKEECLILENLTKEAWLIKVCLMIKNLNILFCI